MFYGDAEGDILARVVTGNKFLPLRVDPLLEGWENNLIEFPPLRVYQFVLND